nr:hypothetical protein [Salinicola salarius]
MARRGQKAAPALRAKSEGYGVASIDGISGDPAGRHAVIERPFQHSPGQFQLADKADLIGNPGLATTFTILCPGLGQVQLAIDENTSLGAGVAEKHANLAVLDTPGRTAVLALNTGGVLPFLYEPVSSRISTPCGEPR